GEDSRLNLKITTAKTDLVGNGTTPVQLLEEDREAIYTAPDKTMSKLLMLDLEGDTNLTEDVVLSGNVYFRRNNIDTQNGDDADYDDCAGGTLLCYEDTNDQVIDSGTGNPVPFAPGGHEIDGTNNMTRT